MPILTTGAILIIIMVACVRLVLGFIWDLIESMMDNDD